jgi:hypothetical protein
VLNQEEKNANRKRSWLKRIGWWGVLFFVVKGIISTGVILFAGNELLKSCN